MPSLSFILVSFFGILIHLYFFQLNEVLKVADSFAYLQMAEYLKEFSSQGFGTGWFGFLYSLPLAGVDLVFQDHFLSAKIVNILCFFLSGGILFSIGKQILDQKYAIFMLILFYISPILLHFNIAILSENIYVLIFLGLFSGMLNMMKSPKVSDGIFIGFFIALMYYTRGEAFIYLGAAGLVSIYLLFKKKLEIKQDFWESTKHVYNFTISQWLGFCVVLFLSFGLFISPYVYHLHSLTGEWGLSNKGSSNLRQAILRGKEQMDDSGFEQAVAELTPDNKNLIAGFAGGLDYNTPSQNISLKEYITEDVGRFTSNWGENQKKLYSQNLPHILLGDAAKLYYNEGSKFFYKNKLFFLLLLVPLVLFVIGYINLFRRRNKDFPVLLLSFFIIASIFFTLFFTLNRYFLIFLPLFLIVLVYGIQTLDSFITFTFTGFSKKNIDTKNVSAYKILKIISGAVVLIIYILGISAYSNTYADRDDYYTIKKKAGEWLKENSYTQSLTQKTKKCRGQDCTIEAISKYNHLKNVRILERFPVTTYYSGTQKRFITPYTSSLESLLDYARHNNIDYLVVDTLDFQKYRSELSFLLDDTKHYVGLTKVHVERASFDSKLQKVVIYKIN